MIGDWDQNRNIPKWRRNVTCLLCLSFLWRISSLFWTKKTWHGAVRFALGSIKSHLASLLGNDGVWLLEECPQGRSWKQLFAEWKTNWGRYESCFASIKRAWNIIEEFTKLHCPEIFTSLNDGLTEEEIDATELGRLNGIG